MPSNGGFPRVLTLWEIMKLFDHRGFSALLAELEKFQADCEHDARRAANHEKPEGKADWYYDLITGSFKLLEKLCDNSGFRATKTKVSLALTHLKYRKQEADYSSLAADARHVRDMLMSEFWNRVFIEVPEEFTLYVNSKALFGEAVTVAFPSAKKDIQDAGNCLAVDCGTAAVFHLMRAVEWALRALCAHLGVIRVRRSNKPGKNKYMAVGWAQWERQLDEVQKRVDKKIEKLGPGKRKQELQEFYYPLLQDLKGFKEAFRNHVMHSRTTYNVKQADGICDHVNRFMNALATKVSE